MAELKYVLAPKQAVGDDHLRIVEWLVPDGSQVAIGSIVVLVDTSKAAFEIESEFEGYLFHLVKPGDRVEIGAAMAVISSENIRPGQVDAAPAPLSAATGGQQFTRKALDLIERHQIDAGVFDGKGVVRHSDVEAYLASQSAATVAAPVFFGAEPLDPGEDWDAVLGRADLVSLQQSLTALRRRLKGKYHRHVPLGTLLHDRWSVANEYRFGEGSSVYDECLILGDVKLGEHCWVGPFTVLDGNFASLRIGDYTSIGSGSHVYTHNTIDRTLTRGEAPVHSADTVIGDACFIGPMAIIGPGSKIGDHSFVASGSYVQGEFPDHSYVAGNPATRVGRVEIRNNRALLLKD